MKVKPESKVTLIRLFVIGIILAFCLRWFYFLYNIGEINVAYSYLYYIPIVFGAFFYGIVGGLLVSSFAGLTYSLFVYSTGTPFGIGEVFASVASFILIGLLSGVLSSSRKRVEEKLREAHKDLEKRVEARTVDLTTANEHLQLEIAERKQAEEELRKTYAQLKEVQEQLIQTEKLRAVGILASGVAHEVKNPLAIIMQGINYLEKKLPEQEDISKILNMIGDSIRTADNIIRSILDFSRDTDLALQSEDINSVLEDSLTLVKQMLKFEQHVEIVREVKQGMPDVLADKNRMEQVFVNILLNAIQSMPDGGKIIIRSYDTQLEEIKNGVGRRSWDSFKLGEKAVIVEIEDTGVGIPEENLKRIFDPFFTTKGPREGAGLGLSVTRSIVDMHEGLIDVESKLGGGTKVTITLKVGEQKNG